MQLNLIDYKELTQTASGVGVNTIMIKCVVFLQKGLNAEKIVLECDIGIFYFAYQQSLNYALFAQSNRSTIREDNLYLHATHHVPSIVFPGMDWRKFI